MLKYNVVARKNPQTKELLYYAQLVPVTAVGLSALAAAISNECTVTIHVWGVKRSGFSVAVENVGKDVCL